MKRILALLILLMTVAIVPAYATDKIKVSPEVYAGIKKYKQGNYASCIQQMRVAIEKMKDDPSIPYYYMGNSFVKLGRVDDAKEAYQKVVDTNKSTGLVNLSKNAITYLNEIDSVTKSDNLGEFIESKKFLHKEVLKDLESKDIERVQGEINSKPNKEDTIDFNKYRYLNDASQNMPTDEEIAAAVKVLARVGYNPYAQNFNNPNYMAMASLMNDQDITNNSFSSMLPYFMARQNGSIENNQALNQQILQNMMLRGMTSGL